MSTKLRKIAAAMAVGVALFAGVASAAPAAAAPTGTVHPMYCGWAFTAPERGGQGVIARASSNGCENIWNFDATLQSSRWYGWHNDITFSWRGNDLRFPTSTCAGTHDHRLMFQANNGLVGYTEYSATVTLTC